jgi:sugar phosphate isomerase/epimerase
VNPIRLEQMAVFDAGALGVVDIAAELGVPMVSFWTASEGTMDGACLVTEEDKHAVFRRLSDTGVRADSIEVFRLANPANVDGWRRAFDVGAYLGATSAAVINTDLRDPGQAAEALAVFAGVAAEFGLVANLEPISMGATRTLAEAEEIIRRSASDRARIAVDVLHLVRTGSSVADLRSLDPGLIGYAQICDGPQFMADEGRRDEGARNRMVPGDGEFPLVDFVSALPPTVVIGVEVPMRRLQDQGVSPGDRASMAIAGTRAVLAQAAAAETRP